MCPRVQNHPHDAPPGAGLRWVAPLPAAGDWLERPRCVHPNACGLKRWRRRLINSMPARRPDQPAAPLQTRMRGSGSSTCECTAVDSYLQLLLRGQQQTATASQTCPPAQSAHSNTQAVAIALWSICWRCASLAGPSFTDHALTGPLRPWRARLTASANKLSVAARPIERGKSCDLQSAKGLYAAESWTADAECSKPCQRPPQRKQPVVTPAGVLAALWRRHSTLPSPCAELVGRVFRQICSEQSHARKSQSRITYHHLCPSQVTAGPQQGAGMTRHECTLDQGLVVGAKATGGQTRCPGQATTPSQRVHTDPAGCPARQEFLNVPGQNRTWRSSLCCSAPERGHLCWALGL